MAQKYGVCTAYLVHDNKAQGGKSHHRASGSGQWVAAARAGFRAGQTEDGRKAIVLAKRNNSGMSRACEYAITGTTVTNSEGEGIKVGRLEWLGECDIQAGDFDYEERKSGELSKAERCKQIILDALADGYSTPQSDIIALCEAAGISKGTAMRVKGELGNVKSTKGAVSWSWQRTDVNAA
jgi:hypothetical protein